MKASRETTDWVLSYYKAVDSGDIGTMMTYFAPDARSRFGNAAFVYGRAAIERDLVTKSRGVRAIAHHFNNIWDADDGVIVLDADIDFTRHDGVVVRAHGAGLFRHHDQLWTEQLHYVDLSGVFGAG
jgi:hypothetical protein